MSSNYWNTLNPNNFGRRIPKIFPNSTNGANDLEISFNYEKIKKSDLYKSKLPSFSCSDIRLSFQCYEEYKEWIPKQTRIIGCMYNLADSQILDLLAQVPFCNIVVNASPWMKVNIQLTPNQIAYKEKIAQQYKKLDNGITRLCKLGGMNEDEIYLEFVSNTYTMIDNGEKVLVKEFLAPWKECMTKDEYKKVTDTLIKDSEGYYKSLTSDLERFNAELSGIRIFDYKKAEDKYESPMHHKFLVGIEYPDEEEIKNLMIKQNVDSIQDLEVPDELLKTSIIYGSANLSLSSPKSLDSVLVFTIKEREEYIFAHELISETNIITSLENTTPWREYFKDEGKEYRKKIKDGDLMKASFDTALMNNEQLQRYKQERKY